MDSRALLAGVVVFCVSCKAPPTTAEAPPSEDAKAYVTKLKLSDVNMQATESLAGQMVTEIEGLRQANPNTALMPEANNAILNNILADQRWRDARYGLADQYFQKYGTLAGFDTNFNAKYPEIDMFNSVTRAAQASGWKVPGQENAPAATQAAPMPKPDAKVQGMINDQTIRNTALKYGITTDEVKTRLRSEGYQIP